MELSKSIFGKTYKFLCDPQDDHILKQSVELYADSNSDRPDVFIKISTIPFNNEMIAHNPSVFIKNKNAIITKFPSCTVYWGDDKKESVLNITLFIHKTLSSVKKIYSKFMSMEYSTETEMFEQILHELVLVPSVYFFEDLSLIHAAALSVNGKAILLAGTGGTGKTSALLALRSKKNVSFISDDICVISKDGLVYPNLAWPKVYGYNLSSYISKSELLTGRGIIDKLQFNIKLANNPKTIRRKVRPDRLYQSFENKGVTIGKIVYLFRDNSEKIELDNLEKSDAIQMGIHIMKTEYAVFNNYLEWDQYNSIVKNVKPLLNVNDILSKWQTNLSNALKETDVKLLHIPSSIDHDKYLKYMSEFISS